jgi:hypothetical protein
MDTQLRDSRGPLYLFFLFPKPRPPERLPSENLTYGCGICMRKCRQIPKQALPRHSLKVKAVAG